MRSLKTLKNLISKYRFKLIFTYTLFSLETIGLLLRPFFLGLAVNDLLKHSFHGLILLALAHFAWLIIGTLRHRYDTRVYTAIYLELAKKLLSKKIETEDVSKLSARTILAKEVVDFFEFDLVYIFEALYNFFGSIILLCFFDSSIVLICLSVLLPVLALSYLYGKKMNRLNKLKNDELEKQVEIISSSDSIVINTHFSSLRKWQIKISDQEAWNFGLMEILVMIVIILCLLFSKSINNNLLLAGNLIAIYNYVLKFVSSLDTIPYITAKFSILKDITSRLESNLE